MTIVSNFALRDCCESFSAEYTVGQSIAPAAEDAPVLQSLRGLVNTALTVAMSGIRVLDISRLTVDLPSPAHFSANADHVARPCSFTEGQWQVRELTLQPPPWREVWRASRLSCAFCS